MKLLFKKDELILELIFQEMMYSNFSILIQKTVKFELIMISSNLKNIIHPTLMKIV